MIQVTVWNEYRHEKTDKAVQDMYPEGIHGQLAKFLGEDQFKVKTATLDEPEHGLTEEVLEDTDVLIWWGHMAHDEVRDEIVERVHKRVLEGMGLVVLHSGHFSKIFKKLMGTSCDLKWREDGKHCRIWNVNPSHPIAEGIGDFIELDKEEMYGEHFDIRRRTNWFLSAGSREAKSSAAAVLFVVGTGRSSISNPDMKPIQAIITKKCKRSLRTGFVGALQRKIGIRSMAITKHVNNKEGTIDEIGCIYAIV
ncbi:hypothetical protein HMSSN139_45040 [Paenibacillus sp. HMSSN-139]|nr:hypothetical protein HMSSN139_45040 [Paenibacillus sp. HMSSN-139]